MIYQDDSEVQIDCTTRTFAEEFLPIFKQENPHLQVIEELQPGRHPYLKAEYREYLDQHAVRGTDRLTMIPGRNKGDCAGSISTIASMLLQGMEG